jgi:uncharacterized protein with HEPN domain
MSPERDFLEDIVVAAHLALRYVQGISRADVENNIEKQDAVIRRLAVIGEAATKVPESIKTALPQIPWPSLIGLRNILVHQYWEVDFYELWLIIQRDLPALIAAIEEFRSK